MAGFSTASICAAIDAREFSIGVMGLGYVGLPLALAFWDAGFDVCGFDIDSSKVEKICSGRSYIGSVSSDVLGSAVASGRFGARSEFDELGAVDALLICVPTPLGPARTPDLEFVKATCTEIAERLRPGQLVVLESTTYPGTTREIVEPILAASGLVAGLDYFLAYSPERENPGDDRHSTSNIPKVVGGMDPASGDVAQHLYEQVVPRVFRVSSADVAEAAKLTENIFRAVNIALVNELKVVYEAMGVDIWEVLDAAETKPFGFMRFDPGPGLGGHCIPIDPFYLAARAREFGVESRFIELAGDVNSRMPARVVDVALGCLKPGALADGTSSALVLGLAYKPNVEDPRESPAFEILDLLIQAGVRVNYYDPLIGEAPRMRSWPNLPALRSVALDRETIASHDVVILVTHHDGVDYELIADAARMIVDSRGVFDPADPKVRRA